MSSPSALPRRIFPVVAGLSVAVLVLQIALNRVFSYTSWHHLADISVSLALRGLTLVIGLFLLIYAAPIASFMRGYRRLPPAI